MTDDLMLIQDRIPAEPKTVLFYLLQRSQSGTRVGLTQQEISRATRLSVGAVRESLGWLESPQYHDAALTKAEPISPFIEVKKKGNHHKIVLLLPYVPEAREVAFTFEDTDDRRIATLEKEIFRLTTTRVQTTNLSMYLRGEKAQLIAEVEADLGRQITIQDAYLLGGMVEKFGPERVRAQWRRRAHTMPRPIVGLWSMFMNDAFGKSAKVESKEPDVQYRPLEKEY